MTATASTHCKGQSSASKMFLHFLSVCLQTMASSTMGDGFQAQMRTMGRELGKEMKASCRFGTVRTTELREDGMIYEDECQRVFSSADCRVPLCYKG